MEKTYTVKYWRDEECRDQGISEIYLSGITLDVAKSTCQSMVDRGYAAATEVYLDGDTTEEAIYFYDGEETNNALC